MVEEQKKENLTKIGAILFAAAGPVEIKKLAAFLKLKESECLEFLKMLQTVYKNSLLGVDLLINSGQALLATDKFQAETVAKFIGKEIREDISSGALEVLSIVAYRGPVSRLEIDEIRGVNSSGILRNLAIRGLIERKENPNDNRSYLYEVSFDFLKNLGIDSVTKLPDYQKLSQKEIFNIVKKEDNQELLDVKNNNKNDD